MSKTNETNDTSEQHPSYGMIGVSHVNSTGTFLVGSEFRHSNFIVLRISRAAKQRDLSREWWFGRERIIEIHLSEAQFVEMVGRPNMGDGIPCTLDWVNGEQQPAPPVPESAQAKFRADMTADATKCMAELNAAHAELVAAIESGKVGKTALKEIAKKIEYAGYAVSSGIPFVAKQFDKHIEATVNHAAVEIEATVANLAMRLGVERMREISESGPKLIDAPVEGERSYI